MVGGSEVEKIEPSDFSSEGPPKMPKKPKWLKLASGLARKHSSPHYTLTVYPILYKVSSRNIPEWNTKDLPKAR